MCHKFLIAMVLFSLLVLNSPASAHPDDRTGNPRVAVQKKHQQKRTAQAARAAQISRKGTQKPGKEQGAIQELKRKAQADGVITEEERTAIRKARKEASGKIADADKEHD